MAVKKKVVWVLTKFQHKWEKDQDKILNKRFARKKDLLDYITHEFFGYQEIKSEKLGRPDIVGNKIITKYQAEERYGGYDDSHIVSYEKRESAEYTKRKTKSNIEFQTGRNDGYRFLIDDKHKKEIREVLKFAVTRLTGLRTYNSLYFRILFRKGLTSKHTVGDAQGSHNCDKPQRIHVIRLRTDRTLEEQSRTTIHEAVHVIQFLRKRLCYKKDASTNWQSLVYWEGELYGRWGDKSIVRPDNSVVEYSDFPWEIEAREMTQVIYKEYRTIKHERWRKSIGDNY